MLLVKSEADHNISVFSSTCPFSYPLVRSTTVNSKPTSSFASSKPSMSLSRSLISLFFPLLLRPSLHVSLWKNVSFTTCTNIDMDCCLTCTLWWQKLSCILLNSESVVCLVHKCHANLRVVRQCATRAARVVCGPFCAAKEDRQRRQCRTSQPEGLNIPALRTRTHSPLVFHRLPPVLKSRGQAF